MRNYLRDTVLGLFVCIYLTGYPSVVFAGFKSWMPFKDVLKICSDNLDDLDLLPTILSQKGWEEVKKKDKYSFYKHVFIKSYDGQEYKISFGDYPAVNKCTVSISSSAVQPRDDLEKVINVFKPVGDYVYGCRSYGVTVRPCTWLNCYFVGGYFSLTNADSVNRHEVVDLVNILQRHNIRLTSLLLNGGCIDDAGVKAELFDKYNFSVRQICIVQRTSFPGDWKPSVADEIKLHDLIITNARGYEEKKAARRLTC